MRYKISDCAITEICTKSKGSTEIGESGEEIAHVLKKMTLVFCNLKNLHDITNG